jgi:hypothetical protein
MQGFTFLADCQFVDKLMRLPARVLMLIKPHFFSRLKFIFLLSLLAPLPLSCVEAPCDQQSQAASLMARLADSKERLGCYKGTYLDVNVIPLPPDCRRQQRI